jgi:hypothetical protein
VTLTSMMFMLDQHFGYDTAALEADGDLAGGNQGSRPAGGDDQVAQHHSHSLDCSA